MEFRPDSVERTSVWERQGSSGWLEQGSGSGQRSWEGWCQALGSAKLGGRDWALLCKVQILEQRNGVCLKPLPACFFPGLEASNSRFTALVIQVRDIILTPPCGLL